MDTCYLHRVPELEGERQDFSERERKDNCPRFIYTGAGELKQLGEHVWLRVQKSLHGRVKTGLQNGQRWERRDPRSRNSKDEEEGSRMCTQR